MSNVTNSLALKRRIMRRVWYSYGISLVTHPFFIHGALLGGGAVLLRELVWLRRVLTSFLAVPVGDTPQWVFERFANVVVEGEVLLLLTLGILTMTVLSLGGRIWRRVTRVTVPSRGHERWQTS
jgi:hypothetical protein